MAKDTNEKKPRPRRKKKNSNEGALIKGMTRRLPIQLLGDLSFEEGLQKKSCAALECTRSTRAKSSITWASQPISTIGFAGTRRIGTKTSGIDLPSSECAAYVT